jgi:hypothetical protein
MLPFLKYHADGREMTDSWYFRKVLHTPKLLVFSSLSRLVRWMLLRLQIA